MLSKSAARTFFLTGTIGFSVVFLGLTLDTIRRVPAQTKEQNLSHGGTLLPAHAPRGGGLLPRLS